MTNKELNLLQKKKLSKILNYAIDKVPYYKDLNISKPFNITDFPILTKTILRENTDRLISNDYKKELLDKNHSSGSSGVQSFTYMAKSHKFYLRALQTHWWTWGGYQPGDSLLQIGISPKRGFVKTLKDFFFKIVYLEAFVLNPKLIKNGLSKFKSKKSFNIAGYPSAIFEIAKVVLKEDKVYNIKSIISYGDKLFTHYIKAYKKAFNNPIIINTYGCAEGLLIACQVDLPYFYIMSPHVYIEIVNDEGKLLNDGEMGHILVTGLTSYGMPLIRYKLGDLGIILPTNEYPNKKKFEYPLLKTVIGRETDIILTPLGDTLIVHSFTGILEYFIEIKQYKIIQISTDEIIVKYITDDGNRLKEDTLKSIKMKINNLTKNSMKILYKKVSSIAASPSGKPQIIENKII